MIHSDVRAVGYVDADQVQAEPSRAPARSTLERMPKWLICIPIVVQWLLLALRYQSLTLPTIANPAITAGGLVGEGKLEYFDGMGPIALASVAPYCALPNHKRHTGAELRDAMNRTSLCFPVVAKPDLGLCGYGVRLIANRVELLDYLLAFPLGETVVLQQYLPQEGEAGIFYIRDPDADGAGDGERRLSDPVTLAGQFCPPLPRRDCTGPGDPGSGDPWACGPVERT